MRGHPAAETGRSLQHRPPTQHRPPAQHRPPTQHRPPAYHRPQDGRNGVRRQGHRCRQSRTSASGPKLAWENVRLVMDGALL
ncbi:hypothetical protein E1294_15360 [Nonomuraea diastatica]|uniref:Uncharacterized protein n=1 Tax=Nonomuraea diastatica TaxID=1848329 RepID=A0A4R4WUD2_9ACTN|nr:hypothetical protein E1294_15360 [Nonomuraea diastatica]